MAPAAAGEQSGSDPVRVLLTGARGFIGSQALEPLQRLGYEVHAVGRSTGGEGACWHACDLLDRDATRALVEEVRPSHLLHLAWFTEHGRFWEAPENLSWAAATLELVRAFIEGGGHRLVLAGTCAEYDWSDLGTLAREQPSDEGPATPQRPGTVYGVAKHATRLLADRFADGEGASFAWGRIFLLYGPGEDPRRLVPHVARTLLAGRAAETSDGSQVRDFMNVADVAAAFVALLDSDVRGAVNIASGDGVTIRQVVETVGAAAGRPDLLRLGALPQREGEPRQLVADVSRLRDEVGFIARIGLEDGVAETVEWWRSRES